MYRRLLLISMRPRVVELQNCPVSNTNGCSDALISALFRGAPYENVICPFLYRVDQVKVEHVDLTNQMKLTVLDSEVRCPRRSDDFGRD